MSYSSEEEEAYLLATQLSSASVFSMVLKSTIELDLLELIKKAGPGAFVSPAQLAAQLDHNSTTNAEALDRIMRFLASYSVLNCTLKSVPEGGVERLYSLAPLSHFWMRNDDGVSMAASVLVIQDKVTMESWCYLKDAVLNGGIPFNKAYGMSVFEYNGIDPRFNKLFNQAMYNHSTIVMKKILETYKGFEGLKCLVDVGGGIGASLTMILSKYPLIKGINFDLPHVIQHAPSHPGVEHIGGDMFVTVPNGDAIFMKWICHDWSDEHCVQLLKKCYEAIPPNGKVILVECIMPEVPDSGLATKNVVRLDMLMLTYNPGGKERTEKEFHTLAKRAGFKQFYKVCCAHNSWIMELCK